MENGISDKSGIACLLFLLLLNPFGIHRMYVGKVGTGILFFLTLGGLGLWWLVDIILFSHFPYNIVYLSSATPLSLFSNRMSN